MIAIVSSFNVLLCRVYNMGDVTPDPDELWAGIGGNFDTLTQVLCEFIDNSLSNFRHAKSKSAIPFWVLLNIHPSKTSGKVEVLIEDNGTGISDFDIAMKLGEKGGGTTQLNEHGFGMKHALATSNPTNDKWRVSTKTNADVKAGEFRTIVSPYTFTINPTHQKIGIWPYQTQANTAIQFEIDHELFDTVQSGVKGKAGFGQTLNYLAEELGFIYSNAIVDGEFTIMLNNKTIPAVLPTIVGHYEINGAKGKITENVDLGAGDVEIKFDFVEIQDSGLAKHYKKSTKCSGVEIRINGRVIEKNLFSEVYDIDPHNLYNHWLVQVDLVSQNNDRLPITRTSKNGFRRGDPKFVKLLNVIKNLYPVPDKKPSDATSEADLVGLLKDIQSAAITNKTKHLTTTKKCWTSLEPKKQPIIDLHIYNGTEVIIYEAKKDRAGPQDVYQLLMYWDGLIADGEQVPEVARLIASEHSPACQTISDVLNTMQDASGNDYNFEITTWKANTIQYPV